MKVYMTPEGELEVWIALRHPSMDAITGFWATASINDPGIETRHHPALWGRVLLGDL